MPRRKSSLVDDLVLLPWWVSAVLAAGAWVVLPGILPQPIVKSGIVAFITVGLLAIAATSAVRGWKTRRMLEQQTGLDSICELPWKRFEDLIGEAYRRQGYKVEETLGGGADGGVDLVPGRNGEVTLVQCKRWRGRSVPVQTVRELYGVLHDRRASEAKLVATSKFTPDAIAFAKGKPMELVDSDALLELLRGVQTSGRTGTGDVLEKQEHRAHACPRCDSEMVLREARRGANAGRRFWGCSNYPTCRGARGV